MTEPAFPPGFVWGAATAAYQIEGSPLADGAGVSTWHRFSHTPGRTHGGDTGDVACDHYTRWRQDVELMRQLGLQAYRLSVSWPRVIPAGHGAVNTAGLDFYDRLVDALLEAGIQPFVTLFHWDLPADLQDRGGWCNRETAKHFGEYAEVVGRRLGDRVGHWITLNEPSSLANRGHLEGMHAPGLRDVWSFLRAVHNQHLGHGRAVQALRGTTEGEIGTTLILVPCRPATAADGAAAELFSEFLNDLYLGPVLRGGYPHELRSRLDYAWPPVEDDDLSLAHQPLDFLGVNYYAPATIQAAPAEGLLDALRLPPDGPTTEMGWPVDPGGLYDVLTWLQQKYSPPPIYITENGAAYEDLPDDAGFVDDADRLEYIASHVGQVARAIDAGVDVRGYFVWSLLDNFEWAYGYSKRFGIVRVDYESQQRTVKRSGQWYSEAIRRNGIPARTADRAR